jgi:hypothetical protein
MPHQHPSSISCHIIVHEKIKIIYLTHIVSILNFIFTVVFYPTRLTKLDNTYICFDEFLNQFNLFYKYRMIIYACFMKKKPLGKLKVFNRNLL